MSQAPERLDVQLRKARLRRDALRIAVPSIVIVAGLTVYGLSSLNTWHWWYVPLVIVAGVMSLWLSLLELQSVDKVTRWFWRRPR